MGKVKEVYETDDQGQFEFVFSDRISVFDKIIPSEIPRKGECLCKTAAFWFKIAKEAGINSHFLSMPAPNRMRVKRVDVIADYSKINTSTTNYLIPLEVIARYYAAGSLLDRLKEGKVKPEDVGFAPGHIPSYGEKLARPMVEFTTKLEAYDRNLSEEEAKKISGLTDKEMVNLKKAVLKIDEKIAERVSKSGLIHVDGKKEFAFDGERRLMIIDTFGTADEDRWWDAEAHKKGEFVEVSKEMVRKYYRDSGYHERLMKARGVDRQEPQIPPLPKDMVEKVSKLYTDLYERMTGEKL